MTSPRVQKGCQLTERIVQSEPDHEVVDGYEAHAPAGPDQERGPGFILVAPGAKGHHAGQRAIEGHQEAPGLREEELVDEEDDQAAGGGAEDCVHDGQGHHGSIISDRDAALGAAIEGEETKDEDEASQTGQRH